MKKLQLKKEVVAKLNDEMTQIAGGGTYGCLGKMLESEPSWCPQGCKGPEPEKPPQSNPCETGGCHSFYYSCYC